MKKTLFALIVLALAGDSARAGELTIAFRDGKVALDAKDVTIRQILTEWARIGKTRIINLERVASPLMTLKLDSTPEREALEIILRAVPGYMAAPRSSPLPGASGYDRILILTSTSVTPARPSAPTFQPPGAATSLRPIVPPLNPGTLPDLSNDADDDDDDDQYAAALARAAAAGLVIAPGMPQPGGGPDFGPLRPPTGPQESPAAAPAPPANVWSVPAGTSTPGLPTPVSPAPPAGQQPVARPLAPRPPQPDR